MSTSMIPQIPSRLMAGRVIWSGSGVGGPLNQAHLETRGDVLCYTSEPIEDVFEIVGPVVLHLFAESDARDTDFVAKIVDVYPDGRSILIGDGSRRARYRHGFDTEDLLEPGRVERFEILLGNTAWRIDPGHRLRVHVTSSNFPRIDRNMNTGRRIGGDSSGIVATQTIHHTEQYPSRLELSVLPRCLRRGGRHSPRMSLRPTESEGAHSSVRVGDSPAGFIPE